MKILGLCGSLRGQSRSMALLSAMEQLAGPDMEFFIFPHIGDLPLFNPDRESSPSRAVRSLWDAVGCADAIVIASPEYAHGMTGTMKNALDWLVGFIPFVSKPVAVLNPSSLALHADEGLKETLRTMSARLIPGACVRIPVMACQLDAQALASSKDFAPLLMSVLDAIWCFHSSGNTESV